MSTETQTRVVTDNIEQLDFEPPCSIKDDNGKCNKPAKWVAYRNCCGSSFLMCDSHCERAPYVSSPWGMWRCEACGGISTTPKLVDNVRIEHL